VRLTRKQLLGAAAAGALGAAGIYELVDELAQSPERAAAGLLPVEQHLLAGMKVFEHEGVEVIEPPLHHQVVTAKLRVEARRSELEDARETLEQVLRRLERRYDVTPAGLAVTVAWGLPYFRRYVPELASRHIPVDRRATSSEEAPVWPSSMRGVSPATPKARFSRATTSRS
jgi:hypothetical protein